jgi:uncharacterized membrane protein
MTALFIGFLALRVLCMAFAVLLVVRLVAAFQGRGPHGARAELDRRFARGEMSAEDYRQRREVLQD